MNASNYIVRGSEQPDLWLLEDRVRPLRETPDYSIYIAHLPSGCGSPPHVHHLDDEGFYIIDGEVTFLYDDQLIVAGPGDFVWGDREVIHCFKCTSSTPARMLLIVTADHFAGFVHGLARPVIDPDRYPGTPPELIETMMRITPTFGIEMRMNHAMPTHTTRAARPSQHLLANGEHLEVLATTEQTAGQLFVATVRAVAANAALHSHNSEELIFVASGQCGVEVDGETFEAGANDLIVIPAWIPHRLVGHGNRISIFPISNATADRRPGELADPSRLKHPFQDFGRSDDARISRAARCCRLEASKPRWESSSSRSALQPFT